MPPHHKAVEYSWSKARAFLDNHQKITTYQPHKWLKINQIYRSCLGGKFTCGVWPVATVHKLKGTARSHLGSSQDAFSKYFLQNAWILLTTWQQRALSLSFASILMNHRMCCAGGNTQGSSSPSPATNAMWKDNVEQYNWKIAIVSQHQDYISTRCWSFLVVTPWP